MARTINYDPKSTEARSSWLSGLAEACNKMTGILNMKTAKFEDLEMPELYISENDRFRIYQIPSGTKLWIDNPPPVIKKNGVPITESNDGFTIDLLGGSIAFEDDYRLTEKDRITASATYIIDSSNTFAEIIQSLERVSESAEQYKGYYPTIEDLIAAEPTGKNGDYALIGKNKSFYIWNSFLETWESTQALSDLTSYYTAEEIDNLLKEKQDNIVSSEETSNNDYYYAGTKTWQNLSAKILSTVLSNLDLANDDKITEVDTIISALGKLQAQINNNIGGLISTGAPTENTEGVLGQDYINSSNGDKYHLVAIEEQEDGSKKYIWEEYANKSDTPTNVVTIDNGANIIMDEKFGEGPFTFEYVEDDVDGDLEIDSLPTEGSENLVTSGGVFTALSGKADKGAAFRVVLLSNAWTNNKQTLNDTRFSSSDKYSFLISPIGSDYRKYTENNVFLFSMNDGSAVFECDTIPSDNLTIDIIRNEVQTGV